MDQLLFKSQVLPLNLVADSQALPGVGLGTVGGDGIAHSKFGERLHTLQGLDQLGWGHGEIDLIFREAREARLGEAGQRQTDFPRVHGFDPGHGARGLSDERKLNGCVITAHIAGQQHENLPRSRRDEAHVRLF